MDSLYADPDRKAYNILGLYYGWGPTFFNPAIIIKMLSRFDALRKAVKNYTIKATPDDRSGVLQQWLDSQIAFFLNSRDLLQSVDCCRLPLRLLLQLVVDCRRLPLRHLLQLVLDPRRAFLCAVFLSSS